MIDGVTRVDGLPGRPGRVALSTIVYVLRWGNLPRKVARSEGWGTPASWDHNLPYKRLNVG